VAAAAGPGAPGAPGGPGRSREQEQVELGPALGQVGQVPVAAVMGEQDLDHRGNPGGRVHRELRTGVQGVLGYIDPVAEQEHRRAADHLHPGEPEPLQVGPGELTPHPHRGGPVQHRPDELGHRSVNGSQRVEVVTGGRLGAHAQHHHRDPQPHDQPGEPPEPLLEVRPERVRQGKHERVVHLVDPVRVAGVGVQAVRVDPRARCREQLERGGAEQQVAAVVADQVGAEGLLGRGHGERVLAGPDQNPARHRHPPVAAGTSPTVAHRGRCRGVTGPAASAKTSHHT
jgi:hypothetical protein